MSNILSVNRTKEAVKDSGGGSFIGQSGIYDVLIKFASVDVSKGGAQSVNFNIEYNGNPTTIYGPYITSKAGDPLDIGLGLIRDKLGIIAGVEGDLTIEEEEHAVGKDNKLQEFSVITDYSDLPVKMRIQMEYSVYNGEIREKKVIKNFFREDGASAEEILAIENGEDVEIGKRLAYETEKFADNITYLDDLTAEDVANWKADKSSNAPAKSAPKSTNTAAKKLFGAKK
jgi:hypothetical protein